MAIELNYNNLNLLPESPAAYTIFAVTNTGLPFQINRICGNDSDGILYYGASDRTIRIRANEFLLSIDENKKTYNHPAGRKIKFNSTIKNFLSNCKLFITFELSNNPTTIENENLAAYRIMFGEHPPLND